MNTRGLTRQPLLIRLIAYITFLLLLSACQPANVSTSLPPVQPSATTPPTQPPTTTQTPVQATQPTGGISGDISLDLLSVAQDWTVETVPAAPASAEGPWWEAAPEHRRVSLLGYPVSDHMKKPQIFIYPAEELAGFNEVAGQMATDLQALLQARQPVERMPFLPLFNELQVMHTQVQYLDFQNGQGVRFLTQFGQGVVPVNNLELVYTFQGLTSDGKTYVAAVLPVTHPELPSTQQVAELDDFSAYLAETVAWLDQQPSGSFTPDLAKLDALIQSIEVK